MPINLFPNRKTTGWIFLFFRSAYVGNFSIQFSIHKSYLFVARFTAGNQFFRDFPLSEIGKLL